VIVFYDYDTAMRSLRLKFLLLLLAVAASGCRGCSSCGNVAKSISETAPEDAVREQAQKELENHPRSCRRSAAWTSLA